jgi:alginate O-acetyltransferase complex protein AlgI
MLFNSYFFLLLFLPLFLFIFFFFKNKLLNTIFFSLLFYFFNSPNFFVMFFLLIIINYYFSKFVKDKFIFISAIIFNLLILIYFKYSILFENLFNINFNNNSLILPLGISFYTFNNIILKD